MARYANVDKLMEHAIRLDWSVLKWVNEVDICNSINPNVQEVKHGKWIKVGDNSYRCSVCNEVSCCNGNFCPDCGAKMEVEE